MTVSVKSGISSVQERLADEGGGTMLYFHHSVYIEPGLIPDFLIKAATDTLIGFPLEARMYVDEQKKKLEGLKE